MILNEDLFFKKYFEPQILKELYWWKNMNHEFYKKLFIVRFSWFKSHLDIMIFLQIKEYET